MSSNDSKPFVAPPSILILGSGVLGLSLAHALTQRPSFTTSTITLLDRLPFPAPDSSSIDTSRIIRADYSHPAYAALASSAQAIWRLPDGPGGAGRYTESGLVLVADTGKQGEQYVHRSFENVQTLMAAAGTVDGVAELPNRQAIKQAVGTGEGDGDWGYLNRTSGWADAEASMRWLRQQVSQTKRVAFHTSEATSLLKSSDNARVTGVRLSDGSTLSADLVVVATGAWTPKLVDLRGRAEATGQVLAYLPLTDAEQAALGTMPVLLNMSSGLFIIPPSNNILKVARHAYGYLNPTRIPHSSDPTQTTTVSLPITKVSDPHLQIPLEGESACREFLASVFPALTDRPFTNTRLCWYTDTPKGDFIIDYHPEFAGLFVATGGSGHAFKFLPVIGERIADLVEEKKLPGAEEELGRLWRWRGERVESVVTEDGSRGGVPGLVLSEELAKRG
jgi:sarcosine oxidase/L-pipecolate oxidase